jgi:hypothetical protein
MELFFPSLTDEAAGDAYDKWVELQK